MAEARRPTLEVFDDPFEFSPDLLLRLRGLESGGFSWTQTAPVDPDTSDSLSSSDPENWLGGPDDGW